ncbi:hypothetical protein K1T71_006134 [Dendrolimus kikuchii]|uniref:Uncharacterized protein n=1 Tax=Dendrolimus kikuchii TaxID=765133 RepID=A0ACC1D3C6_9NEOP|nr:hypothetical protein K1T71_006134 [Dendrolimus kikuchii]
MLVTYLALALLLFYIIENVFRKPPEYPPGPSRLPLLGNIISVYLKLKEAKYYHEVWQAWAKKYGDIIGLQLGFVNVVIVTGKDLIREVSSREVFEGRPDGFFYTMRSFGKKLGIVFSDGPTWSSTRLTVLKYLKKFGYNARFMETYISEECKALVKLRLGDAGKPVTLNHMFHITIVNIMWQLVAGKRYDLEDQRLKKLCNLITDLFKAVDMSGGVLNFVPFLRYLFPNAIGYTKLKLIHNNIHQFLEETIKEHKSKLDINNPKDVIDALLIDMLEHKEKTLSIKELQVVCLDLLEAGMETVSSTAVFMLLYIVRDEAVQTKLHKEIDEVIGRFQTPSLNDKVRMVYTEAVLLETLRMSSVAAVGIPHMALEDAILGSYLIPKGTFILLSMYQLHHAQHWKDPYVFRPERFLTKDGNLMQDDWLMPFGAGRRRCIGEGLARAELFLFLTHLLQKFRLKVPDGESLPSVEPVDGLTLSAKPFKLVFEPIL